MAVAQGYAIAKPMPAEWMAEWVRSYCSPVDAVAREKALPRLAKLLVWVDRLILNIEASKRIANFPAVFRCSRGDMDADCQDRLLTNLLTEFEDVLPPGRSLQEAAQKEVINAALTGGPHSEAFRSAYRRLVTVISDPPGPATAEISRYSKSVTT